MGDIAVIFCTSQPASLCNQQPSGFDRFWWVGLKGTKHYWVFPCIFKWSSSLEECVLALCWMSPEKGGLRSSAAGQHHILWGRTGCKPSRGGEKKLRAQREAHWRAAKLMACFSFDRRKEKDAPCFQDFFFVRDRVISRKTFIGLHALAASGRFSTDQVCVIVFFFFFNRPSLLFSHPLTAFNVYTVAGN